MKQIENQIDACIKDFVPCELQEIKKLKSPKKNNNKYVFSIRKLPDLLKDMKGEYRLLYIDDIFAHPHTTIYFDTANYTMYNAHQNGKLKRCKVRYKNFNVSNNGFLEIKCKNNKGEKRKKKISFNLETQNLSDADYFLNKHSPFSADELIAQTVINYKRLYFINLQNGERVTCDYKLNISSYGSLNETINLEHLCILEIKRSNGINNSFIAGILHKHKIFLKGLSKYCIGLAAMNKNLKHNKFKEKLRKIDKLKIQTI